MSKAMAPLAHSRYWQRRGRVRSRVMARARAVRAARAARAGMYDVAAPRGKHSIPARSEGRWVH